MKLSKAAAECVRYIAQQSNTSVDDMLEYMIQSFASSTPEEKENQKQTRMKQLNEYMSRKDPVDPIEVMWAWQAGFSAGWVAFQNRKALPRKAKVVEL